MRFVVAIIGSLVSTGLICVSILMNFRFGQMLGKTELDGLVYGLASACADGFKVILPFTAVWAWRNHRFLVALASVCLFLIFSAYSITSSLGFSATNRAETTGSRAKAVSDYQDLRKAYQRTLLQREALPASRPMAMLQGLIEAKRQNIRWTSTRRCIDATVKESRDFCQDYFQLTAELGTARQAEHLDTQIASLQKRLETFNGGAVTEGQTDPQVQILKDLSGLAQNRVEMALTIILTLLVELGSGFGLFVSFGHGQPGERTENTQNTKTAKPHLRVKTPPSIPFLIEHAPVTDKDWALRRLLHDPTSHTAASELYQDYCGWCQKQKRTNAMTLTAFCKWLVDLGFDETVRIEGRVCFVGVRLKLSKS